MGTDGCVVSDANFAFKVGQTGCSARSFRFFANHGAWKDFDTFTQGDPLADDNERMNDDFPAQLHTSADYGVLVNLD